MDSCAPGTEGFLWSFWACPPASLRLTPFCVPHPGLCPDWETWDPVKPVENATEAMQLADDWLGIPQVRTAACFFGDVLSGRPLIPRFLSLSATHPLIFSVGIFPAEVKGQQQQLCLVS